MRFIFMAFVATLFWTAGSAAIAASPTLTGSATKIHPTTAITLTGTGFDTKEYVDIYFDATDTLLVVSSSAGGVASAITVPASAAPGTHYITAVGRRSGDSAKLAVMVTTPWVQMGYNTAHTGWNPYENILSTSTVPTLRTLWSAPINASGSTPVRDGKYLYVGTLAGVFCLNATTGAKIWSAATNDQFYGSPAMVGGVLYIAGSASNTMYAFNASTGAVIWTAVLSGATDASPLVTGGKVYIGDDENNFHALNASTGATVWTYAARGQFFGSAAAAGSLVYIASNDGNVYALNATTGAMVWTFNTGFGIIGSPAIASGVVYLANADANVYAVRAKDGKQLWSTTTDGRIFSAPSVDNNLVYVGTTNGTLYGLDVHTGAVTWSNATGTGGASGTIVANGVVYALMGTGALDAVSASSGAVLASGNIGRASIDGGGPAVSDGVVYVDAYGGSVYALASNAGQSSTSLLETAPSPALLHPDTRLRISPSDSAAPLPQGE